MPRGYSLDRDDYAKRLARIEGQVRGVAGMVTSDAYCIDVMTQISAIKAALDKVALGLLHDHLGHCVVSGHGADGKADQAALLEEATAAIARLVKS